MSSETRGIRNRNVGNIRYNVSNDWLGKIKPPLKQDNEFEEFKSYEYGIRAIIKLLQTYHEKYNINDIKGIVKRYAPVVENDTDKYIQQVENITGIRAGKNIDFTPDSLKSVIKAIAKIESNYVITDSMYSKAVSLL